MKLTTNAIEDVNGNLITPSVVEEAECLLLTIYKPGGVYAGIVLKPEDVASLKELLDAAVMCAGRGHDAVPERRGDRLHYECRRCGAEWEQYA